MKSRTQAIQKLHDTGDLVELRRWLRAELACRADAAATADVLVATQEAVTNSLRAQGRATPPVRVRISFDDCYVWVEVRDFGPGFARMADWWRQPPVDRVHGRGLFLMGALMDVFEVTSRPYGSRVRMGRRLAA